MENKNIPPRREIPENVRKMLEQKNAGSSVSNSIPQRPVAGQPVQNNQTRPLPPQRPNVLGPTKPSVQPQRPATPVPPPRPNIQPVPPIQQNESKPVYEPVNNYIQPEQPKPQPLTQTQIVQQQEVVQQNNSVPQTSNVNNNIDQPTKLEKQKPEKVKKVKPEKQTKVKNTKPKKKKKMSKMAKLGIFLIVFVILAAGGGVAYFMMQPKPEKMEAPKVVVHQLSNQTMLYVPANKNAEYYEFYIQKGEDQAQYIKSPTNEITLYSVLQDSFGDYKVWARYGSSNKEIISDYSEIETCRYYKQLQTPTISYKTGDNSKIVWQPISDVTEYVVYYGTGTIIVPRPHNPTELVTFDIAEEFKSAGLSAGNYSIQVQAKENNNEFYDDSNLSNALQYVYKITLDPVISAVFDKATNVIKIGVDIQETPTQTYEIKINFTNKVQTYKFNAEELKNVMEFDLSLSIQNSGCSVNDIVSISVIAKAENSFSTDSIAVSATIK